MNTQGSICRIGVFYDGTHFSKAQQYYYDRQMGWLSFQPFHSLIEHFVHTKEQSFASHKVVYASWHQGFFNNGTERQLQFERNLYHDFIRADIEPKFQPMSPKQGEKGVDVALALDALQTGLDGKIDIAVLVSSDGDFVPLVRVLNKQAIRVIVAYFKFTDSTSGNRFVNEQLLKSCDYPLDISELDKNWRSMTEFKSLFRPTHEWSDNGSAQEPDGVGSEEKVYGEVF